MPRVQDIFGFWWLVYRISEEGGTINTGLIYSKTYFSFPQAKFSINEFRLQKLCRFENFWSVAFLVERTSYGYTTIERVNSAVNHYFLNILSASEKKTGFPLLPCTVTRCILSPVGAIKPNGQLKISIFILFFFCSVLPSPLDPRSDIQRWGEDGKRAADMGCFCTSARTHHCKIVLLDDQELVHEVQVRTYCASD